MRAEKRVEPLPDGRGSVSALIAYRRCTPSTPTQSRDRKGAVRRVSAPTQVNYLLMRILPLLFAILPLLAQPPAAAPPAAPPQNNDQVLKAIDDLQWRLKLSDIADVDKVQYASLPPHRNPNP